MVLWRSVADFGASYILLVPGTRYINKVIRYIILYNLKISVLQTKKKFFYTAAFSRKFCLLIFSGPALRSSTLFSDMYLRDCIVTSDVGLRRAHST